MTLFVVTAVGMMTSLGTSVDACAGARAGLVRTSEIATFNTAIEPLFAKEDVDGIPAFVGHSAPIVGNGCTGLAKLLALSRPALQELLRGESVQPQSTGLVVNISDKFFETHYGQSDEPLDEGPSLDEAALWTRIVQELPARLCGQHSLAIRPEASVALAGGHAGFVAALRRGAAMIRGGTIERCIVGAADSCIEPKALQAYAAARAVKTADNPVGFMPGEAAVFAMLERASVGDPKVGLQIVSTAQAKDCGFHAEQDSPCGIGLGEAMVAALDRYAGRAGFPALLINDLNGTEARATDWGHVLVRMRAAFDEHDFAEWLPAASFGETGGASGGLALGMAFRAALRGYLPAGGTLIALSSEGGERAAMLVEATAAAGRGS